MNTQFRKLNVIARLSIVAIIATNTILCINHVNTKVQTELAMEKARLSTMVAAEEVKAAVKTTSVKVTVEKAVVKEAVKPVPKKPKKVLVASRGGQNFYDTDQVLLAKLIESEAGIERMAGKLAVGTVVLNRLETGKYGETLKDVIYMKGQFHGVGTDEWNKRPSDASMESAELVLKGYRSFGSEVLYYYNPEISTDKKFINSIQPVTDIGRHTFAKRKN